VRLLLLLVAVLVAMPIQTRLQLVVLAVAVRGTTQLAQRVHPAKAVRAVMLGQAFSVLSRPVVAVALVA